MDPGVVPSLAMTRVYQLRQRADGVWQCVEDGKEAPLFIARKREEAQHTIYDHAREQGDCRVLVYNSDGSLFEERTFPPPPKYAKDGPWG